MTDNDTFDYESIQDSITVKNFIQSLIDGIEKGRIQLNSNGEEIVLNPAQMFKFTVKARRKGGTGKISLKISWKEQNAMKILSEGPLEISTEK